MLMRHDRSRGGEFLSLHLLGRWFRTRYSLAVLGLRMWARDPPKCPAWLGNVGLMIGATLATLVVIELAFRLFLGHQIVLFPRNHAAAQYGAYTLRSMTPNAVFWHQSMDGQWRFRTNNKGFRDERITRMKSQGELCACWCLETLILPVSR